MIDEKILDELEREVMMSGGYRIQEVIRLARLGLWAERPLSKYSFAERLSAFFGYPILETKLAIAWDMGYRAALAKEEK